MLTLTGLQKYYEYLASQKNVVHTMEKREIVDRNKTTAAVDYPHLDRTDSEFSGKKKRKGKGLRRLIGSYVRDVEGLQMIQ